MCGLIFKDKEERPLLTCVLEAQEEQAESPAPLAEVGFEPSRPFGHTDLSRAPAAANLSRFGDRDQISPGHAPSSISSRPRSAKMVMSPAGRRSISHWSSSR